LQKKEKEMKRFKKWLENREKMDVGNFFNRFKKDKKPAQQQQQQPAQQQQQQPAQQKQQQTAQQQRKF